MIPFPRPAADKAWGSMPFPAPHQPHPQQPQFRPPTFQNQMPEMQDFMPDMFPLQPKPSMEAMVTGHPPHHVQPQPGLFPQPVDFPHPGAWPPPPEQPCPGYLQEWLPPNPGGPGGPGGPGLQPQALLGPLDPMLQGTPPTPHFQALAMGQQPMGQSMGQQPISQQPMGQQPVGQQPVGQQPVGQQPMGQQLLGQQPMGQQQVGHQPVGQQPMGQQPMGQQPLGQQPMGQQLLGQPLGQPNGQPLGQLTGPSMGQPMCQPLGSQTGQAVGSPYCQQSGQPMGQMMSPPVCWAQPQELGNPQVQLDPVELQRVATPQQATLRPAFSNQASRSADVIGPHLEKMVLAVDVDEVLCRCAEAFVLWQTGKVLLDVNECFQICYAHSNAAAREQFFNSEAAVNAQAVSGAFEALQTLRALNFEVHAITARPASSQSMTYQFLQRCFPGMIGGLHLSTPSSPSKGAIAKSLGACGLVDDQLPHVLEASQQLPAVLFDLDGRYFWTKTSDVLPQAVVRKTSWPEVVEWACAQLHSARGIPAAYGPPGQTSLVQTSAETREKLTGAQVAISPTPVQTVEVSLDCVKAFGLDKDFSFSINLVLQKGEPMTIGRSHQTDAFEKLVPDDALRSCVSRSHFTISWDGERFFLRRLSVNAMFLDDVMIPQQQEVLLNKGGHIGLCSEANGRSSFLLLRFALGIQKDPYDPPLGEVEPKQTENTHESSWCTWATDLSSCPFYLLCTMSASRDISHLPAERRGVALTRSVMLGRQHQPGLFEGILGPDSVNLTFISRSHLELNEVETGNFMMRNLSQNPVVVKGSQQVAKEQQSFLSPGDSIEFIAGSDLKCFLRFHLEQTEAQPRVAVPVPTAPTFWLELDGSAVRDLPLEHRRVHPQVGSQGPQSLAVGRAFQHELHQALNEEALAWVSREHFRIEVDGHGHHGHQGHHGIFTLVALSSNPMWRQRAEELLTMEKHDTLPLERGDRIWLYTGASDGQPSGPGHKGTIVWTFCI